MFKVGIVGLRRGLMFLSFNAVPNFKVTAICDSNRDLLETYGKEYDVPQQFTKYEDMTKSADLDAVAIATPIMFHVPQAVQAMNAGIDIISEVTAAATFEECRTLVDVVEQNGRKYMMAENCCYLKENILVKELIAAGKFGELYFGEADMIIKWPDSVLRNPDGSLNWKGRMVYERNGNVYPTHSLGPLYQMFKERVVSVRCLGPGVHTIPEAKLEDTVITLCKTESGKLLKIRLDIISNRPQNHNYNAIQGTRGCYEAPRGLGDAHKVWFIDDCKVDEWKPLSEYEEKYLPEEWKNPPKETKMRRWGMHDYFMVKDFAESIVHNKRPPIDVYDAVNMTAPGLASEISIAQGGKPVEVPDFRKR